MGEAWLPLFFLFCAYLMFWVHVAYCVFVVAGGLLCIFRPGVIRCHGLCTVWAIVNVYFGLSCPLSTLERALLTAAGRNEFVGFLPRFREMLGTTSLLPSSTAVLTGQILLLALGSYLLAFIWQRVPNRSLEWRKPSKTRPGHTVVRQTSAF